MKFSLLPLLLMSSALFGQHGGSDSLPAPEAKNLLQAFRNGHFHGHFRAFFMATDNTRQLTDYYALAAGGSLHFNTAAFHGFRFGVGGAFNYKLASSDLGRPDSATKAVNRYEIGLFDVENPGNRNDLDRMEEFWLRYEWRKSRITIGQQSLQTPFINDQDGRMRPTVENGVWADIGEWNHTRLEGGWLWGISPRSTVKWYSIGTSIGLYPKGLNPDGTASNYPENLHSKGVGLLGLTRQFGARTKLQVWNQYVDNIMNTAFAQVDHSIPFKNGHRLLLGLQLLHQDALANGGNDDPSKRYISPGAQSNALSAQAGWQHGGWQALLAYTRVTADGRFLTPREWGREPFYTFMSRERIEGSGDSHSLTGRLGWQTKNKKLRIEAAYGHFYLPDVKNAALNKYAFPAFRQFNFDARYTFGGALNGLRAQLLYVYKGRLGAVYGQDKYVINRVNMAQYNLILNYTY